MMLGVWNRKWIFSNTYWLSSTETEHLHFSSLWEIHKIVILFFFGRLEIDKTNHQMSVFFPAVFFQSLPLHFWNSQNIDSSFYWTVEMDIHFMEMDKLLNIVNRYFEVRFLPIFITPFSSNLCHSVFRRTYILGF